MSEILPRWFAEPPDRLLATDGLIARGAEEDDDEDKMGNGEDGEEEGYLE